MQILRDRLQDITAQGLLRTLSQPQGCDLSSNDYLGFASDPLLQQRFIARLATVPQGGGASRLLRGNLALYEETEKLLANFVQRSTALLFPSGYQANLAIYSTLLHEQDCVFSDELNHASIIDGIRLAKTNKYIYRHRDLNHLETLLKNHATTKGLNIIATESLFSMEGTIAPLAELAELAERYHALLIVDEAHSTGIYGSSLVAKLGLTDRVFATVHPAGKALGAAGAWIAGDEILKKYLINCARPFIFSTAPIPALAILLQEAIAFYQVEGEKRAGIVLQRAKKLADQLSALKIYGGAGPILGVHIGDNDKAILLSEKLRQENWDVRAIRPPTVPHDTARLRITVKWRNSEEELKLFTEKLLSFGKLFEK